MARPKCLLLVDTDGARQALVRGALRRRADLVLVAASSSDAWRCLEECAVPIDWVLFDESVEGAIAFATELRRRDPRIGIMLSVESAMDSPIQLLRKPYTERDLWAVMGQG